MKYIEQVNTRKVYDVTVDIDDFIEWLDGDIPSYENLVYYLSEGSAGNYDFLHEEEEDIMDATVLHYDEFLKEVEDAIKSRD